MPSKHQPDLIYLRYVPLWKVHVFTLVQLTCLVLLWVIKASSAAVVFPMMVMTSISSLMICVVFMIYVEDRLIQDAKICQNAIFFSYSLMVNS